MPAECGGGMKDDYLGSNRASSQWNRAPGRWIRAPRARDRTPSAMNRALRCYRTIIVDTPNPHISKK